MNSYGNITDICEILKINPSDTRVNIQIYIIPSCSSFKTRFSI